MSLYLGTSQIAGGMSAETLVDTLYPVDSCYIGTGATCPLAAIKGTWTLQSSGIVTSVNTNVPVKGNGMTLGMTNGTDNVAPKAAQTSWGYTGYDSKSYGLNLNDNPGGTALKTGIFGITTDATKSGIVGTVTRSVLSVNIWKRTA